MTHTRKTRWLARLAGTCLVAGGLLPLLAPGTALAHERRVVGPYTFVVGFMNEPALQGQPNGIDLRITQTDGGAPVEGAEKTLKAGIAFGGGQPKDFPLRTRYGQPGAYTADLIPTKAGSYLFTFTGTIDGNPVNQTFESGPGRFDDVQATDKLQFPEAVPAPATLAASVQSAGDRAQAAEARAAAAEGKLSQAQGLGAAGVVLGLLGLGAGGWALLSARRSGAGEQRVTVGPSAARP
jgi:hypothetical protein